MRRQIFSFLSVVALILVMSGSAYPITSYLTTFNSTYGTSATVLNTCGICHINPAGGGSRNSYGTAYANNGHNFKTIESLDSDGDTFTNLAEINARTFPGDAASHPAVTPPPPAACTYTYSTWGSCQSTNTQTRTVVSSSPTGCTGTPVVTQACVYVPPPPAACTYTYSAWGSCQSTNTQTRTVLSSSPAGCTGTPAVSQACTYVPPPPVTLDGAALYSTNCSGCHGALASTTVTKPTSAATIQSMINSGAMGTGVQALTSAQVQAIADAINGSTPPPAACAYTYSTWGTCQSSNTQTRTVLSSSPAGCTGTPVVSQACVYVPPPPAACAYTYSTWGTCQSSNTQTRTVLSSSPAGCTGTPVVSQTCVYVPPPPPSSDTVAPAITTFRVRETEGLRVYLTLRATDNIGVTGYMVKESYTTPLASSSGWRSSAPYSYTFTTGGSKTLYAWVKDAAGNISARARISVTVGSYGSREEGIVRNTSPTASMPASNQQTTSYEPTAVPVRNADPALAKPVGVGSVAEGGNTLSLQVSAGRFTGPMDISLALYVPSEEGSLTPANVFMLSPSNSFEPAADGMLLWKKGVTAVNEKILVDIPVSELYQGQYVIIMGATHSDSGKTYHNWMTSFSVQ